MADVPGLLHQGRVPSPLRRHYRLCNPDVDSLPLAHYRWHGIYDHLTQGNCDDGDKCDEALWSGRSLTAVYES